MPPLKLIRARMSNKYLCIDSISIVNSISVYVIDISVISIFSVIDSNSVIGIVRLIDGNGVIATLGSILDSQLN